MRSSRSVVKDDETLPHPSTPSPQFLRFDAFRSRRDLLRREAESQGATREGGREMDYAGDKMVPHVLMWESACSEPLWESRSGSLVGAA